MRLEGAWVFAQSDNTSGAAPEIVVNIATDREGMGALRFEMTLERAHELASALVLCVNDTLRQLERHRGPLQ